MKDKVTRGKRSGKYHKNLTGRRRVLSAHESLEKSRDTKSLLPFMIIIPIVIVVLILLIVLFVLAEINDKPQGHTDTAQNVSKSESYVLGEENAKLLTIASSDSPLDSSYSPDIEDFDGIKYDAVLAEPLEELIAAASEDGIALKVTGGYVSSDEQDKLFQAEVARLMDEGYSRVKAENEAEKSVPRGGECDRQTGLSVVISCSAGSKEASWLSMHAHEYGFIQRYPESKEEETGVSADASLFRYVGTENASKILMLGMSLDEYVDYVSSR